MLRSGTCRGWMSMFEEKMKDSSPLPDEDSFQQCIKVFHEFLLGLGFPGTINVKSLHTTAPEDCFKFYLFAHHFSGSSFQFPTNELEGETVELLKDLRYPVALFKNSVCLAVHHPELLGRLWLYWLNDWVLNWQIVQIMCLLKEKESSFPCDVEEGAEFNEPLMEYCRDTYGKFLLGARTIEKKDRALINKLLKWLKLDKKRFFPQQEKRRVSMEELERMERECQNRLKRVGSPQSREADLEKQKTPEDIERDNRESEELQQIIQSQTQYVDEIKQRLRNDSDSDTELGGNGAAGVERGGKLTEEREEKAEEVKSSFKEELLLLALLCFLTLFVCFIEF